MAANVRRLWHSAPRLFGLLARTIKKGRLKALILGLTSSQRAITEFMSSTGDSFLAPKASTASVAVIKHRYSFRRPSVLSFAYAASNQVISHRGSHIPNRRNCQNRVSFVDSPSKRSLIEKPFEHVAGDPRDVVLIVVVAEAPRPGYGACRENGPTVRRFKEHHVGAHEIAFAVA